MSVETVEFIPVRNFLLKFWGKETRLRLQTCTSWPPDTGNFTTAYDVPNDDWRRFNSTVWKFYVDVAKDCMRIHHCVAACHLRPTAKRAASRPAGDQSTSDLSCRQWNINNNTLVVAGLRLPACFQPSSESIGNVQSADTGLGSAKIRWRISSIILWSIFMALTLSKATFPRGAYRLQ